MKRRSEPTADAVPALCAIATCIESGGSFDTWELTVHSHAAPIPLTCSRVSVPVGYRAESRLIDALLALGLSTHSWMVLDSATHCGRVAPLRRAG